MQLFSMIEFALGIGTAISLCDAVITYGIFSDYMTEKAAGKVRSFGEYFWKGYNAP